MTYRCTILVCGEGDVRINPSHAWLHAVVPDTYDPPHAEDQPFMCKNSQCMGYCQRPGAYRCVNSGRVIHRSCILYKGRRS